MDYFQKYFDQLEAAETGTERVDALNELAHAFQGTNPVKCKEYLDQAETLTKKLYYKEGLVDNWLIARRWAHSTDQPELSNTYYKKVKKLLSEMDYVEGQVRIVLAGTEEGDLKDKDIFELLDEAQEQCLLHNLDHLLAYVYGAYHFAYRANNQIEQAELYCEKAKQQFERVEDERRMASCYNLLAVICRMKSDFAQSLVYLEKAAELVEKTEYHIIGIQVYHQIGNAYYVQGDYPKSMRHYMTALKVAEKYKLKSALASSLMNVANIHAEEGNSEKALELYNRALVINKEIDNQEGYATNLLNIGGTYLDLEDYERALNTFEEARAFFYNSKEVDIVSNKLLAYNMYGIAGSHKGLGKREEALSYYEKALELFEKGGGDKYHQAEILIDLADIYLEDEKYDLVEENGNLALQLSNEIGSENNIKKALELLYQLYKAKEDYEKALQYYEDFTALKEKLFSAQKSVEIWRMESAYKLSNKDKEIELLEKDKIIQSQKITELEQSQQISQMNMMIEGQESERKRIAAELHDGLGTSLSTLKIQFSGINTEMLSNTQQTKFNDSMTLLDKCCREVRNISHNLMPKSIIDADFATVVRSYMEDLESIYPFSIQVHIEDVPNELEEKLKVNLYRILQESMNNIIKYAEATEINVQLIQHDTDLVVIIEDNGKGFELETALKNGGIGLKSIGSRVKFLKGEYEIDTTIGMGTCITIEIPNIIPTDNKVNVL